MQEEAKLPATRRKRKKLASEEPPPPAGVGAARTRRRAGPDDSASHDSAIGPSDHHAGLQRHESSQTTSRRERRHGRGSESLSKVAADAVDDDEEGTWDESLHRLFVEALFEIGLDQASPSVLMEHMNLLSGGDNINNKKHSFSGTADRRRRSEQQAAPMIAVDEVNSERVKSHLQKFRKNKSKSLGDFFDEYDRWMELAVVDPTATASTGIGYPGGGPRRDAASSAAGLYGDFAEVCKKMIKDDNAIVNRQNLLRGGDLAAFLSYAAMRDDKLQQQQQEKADFVKGSDNAVPAATSNTSGALSTTQQRHGGGAASNNGLSLFPGQHHDSQHPSLRDYSPLLSSGARIAMPRLSKQEEDSMLGKSFHQVASLFQNVSRLIMAERTTPQQASFHEESTATILSSVVTDPPRLVESISGPLPPTSRGLDNY